MKCATREEAESRNKLLTYKFTCNVRRQQFDEKRPDKPHFRLVTKHCYSCRCGSFIQLQAATPESRITPSLHSEEQTRMQSWTFALLLLTLRPGLGNSCRLSLALSLSEFDIYDPGDERDVGNLPSSRIQSISIRF